MTKVVLEYLCRCQGWNTAVKSLHWNSSNLSQHKLCDDIAKRLSDFQDQVGEVEQSITGNLPFNKLKPIEYKVKNLKKFVEDVITRTNTFYQKIKGKGEKYVGMASDCESFLSDMQRSLYLVNFTIKEDFMRNYKNRINEEKKTVEVDEKTLIEAIVNATKKVIQEGCCEADVKGGMYHDDELNYTHFAVNRTTNLIVDGWDYSGYDSDELRQFKNDYFMDDLRNNGFNPKAYKILTFAGCKKAGLDPNDSANWSNTGVFPLFHEQHMNKNGEKPWDIAYERHPDWFVTD